MAVDELVVEVDGLVLHVGVVEDLYVVSKPSLVLGCCFFVEYFVMVWQQALSCSPSCR